MQPVEHSWRGMERTSAFAWPSVASAISAAPISSAHRAPRRTLLTPSIYGRYMGLIRGVGRERCQCANCRRRLTKAAEHPDEIMALRVGGALVTGHEIGRASC